jgi:hypothetical protein
MNKKIFFFKQLMRVVEEIQKENGALQGRRLLITGKYRRYPPPSSAGKSFKKVRDC